MLLRFLLSFEDGKWNIGEADEGEEEDEGEDEEEGESGEDEESEAEDGDEEEEGEEEEEGRSADAGSEALIELLRCSSTIGGGPIIITHLTAHYYIYNSF